MNTQSIRLLQQCCPTKTLSGAEQQASPTDMRPNAHNPVEGPDYRRHWTSMYFSFIQCWYMSVGLGCQVRRSVLFMLNSDLDSSLPTCLLFSHIVGFPMPERPENAAPCPASLATSVLRAEISIAAYLHFPIRMQVNEMINPQPIFLAAGCATPKYSTSPEPPARDPITLMDMTTQNQCRSTFLEPLMYLAVGWPDEIQVESVLGIVRVQAKKGPIKVVLPRVVVHDHYFVASLGLAEPARYRFHALVC